MKIGILCFQPRDDYDFSGEQALVAAAKKLGHSAELVMLLDSNAAPSVHFDVCISQARVLDEVETRLYPIHLLEAAGMPVLNSYKALLVAKNKWLTTQALRAAALPVLPTVLVDSPAVAAEQAKEWGYPVVLKAQYGTFGLFVEKAEQVEELASVFKKLSPMGEPLLLQPLIREAKGKDVRVFVVGNHVVASMERSVAPGDFRANMERGGTATAYEPLPGEVELALKAVRALDLDFAGVDLIRTSKGPAILEVNGNPGFEALEIATGVNVAAALVQFAAHRASGWSQSHR